MGIFLIISYASGRHAIWPTGKVVAMTRVRRIGTWIWTLCLLWAGENSVLYSASTSMGKRWTSGWM